jgi:hypothetical protein
LGLFSQAMLASRGLDALGSTLPRLAITAFLPPAHRAALALAGYCVLDFTPYAGSNTSTSGGSISNTVTSTSEGSSISTVDAAGESERQASGVDLMPYFHPVYSEAAAQAQGRRVASGQPLHKRLDGAGTYYKLLAFALTGYRRVLLFDADVVFLENPDPFVVGPLPPAAAATPGSATDAAARGAAPAEPLFLFEAHPETAHRQGYTGLRSNLALLRPHNATLAALLAAAHAGAYTPYTNTEQDVLEAHFTVARGNLNPRPHLPRVRHDSGRRASPRLPPAGFSTAGLSSRAAGAAAKEGTPSKTSGTRACPSSGEVIERALLPLPSRWGGASKDI